MLRHTGALAASGRNDEALRTDTSPYADDGRAQPGRGGDSVLSVVAGSVICAGRLTVAAVLGPLLTPLFVVVTIGWLVDSVRPGALGDVLPGVRPGTLARKDAPKGKPWPARKALA